MSFCFLYNVVLENYSVQNSPWGGGGSIVSSRSTMFCYLMLDFCVRTRVRFSLRDKRLFEITEVEITRVDCNSVLLLLNGFNDLFSFLSPCLMLN